MILINLAISLLKVVSSEWAVYASYAICPIIVLFPVSTTIPLAFPKTHLVPKNE